MLNFFSIGVGAVAFLFMLVGLVPLLGLVNWVALPLAVVGAGLGVLSSHNTGRNLNILVLVIAVIRMSIGGFII